MSPINYTQNVQQPFQAALQGFQVGDALRQRQMQEQQMQQQMQQQQAVQARVQSVMSNPNATATDYASIMALVDPKVAESINKAWQNKSTEQTQAALSHSTQVYAALKNGRPDIAAKLYNDRADALEAAGMKPQAAQFRARAEQAVADPTYSMNVQGLEIAGIPGGKDAIEAFGKAGQEQRAAELQPLELDAKKAAVQQAKADAQVADIKAKYGEQSALLDIQKKGWDITAIQQDIQIRKQANAIAAMNAATARETNVLKRDELKLEIQKRQSDLDGKVRDKVATAESGAASIDNMLNTIERIKLNPRLNDVLGGIEGRVPAVRDDSVDAVALIETLGSQAFLAQIPNIKGMGALSNAEGEKLQSALQNLSRTQSETQFRANLNEAARLLLKGRETLSRSTGVPLGKPDTPAAPGMRPSLDSFFKP